MNILIFYISVTFLTRISISLDVTLARCRIEPVQDSSVRIKPPIQSRRITTYQRVIVAVGVPVRASLCRVAAKEAPYARVVVPVAKHLQPGGAVVLVVRCTVVEHRCRRTARAADCVAKGVVEYRVCHCPASGNAPSTALGIRVVGVGGTTTLFAQTGGVGCIGILDERAASTCTFVKLVRAAGAVGLRNPLPVPVICIALGHSCWQGNTGRTIQ